jgi:hypothetical protein
VVRKPNGIKAQWGFSTANVTNAKFIALKKKVKLNVSHPCADTSLNTRPNAAFDSRHPARILI